MAITSASAAPIKQLHPNGESVQKTVDGLAKQPAIAGTMRELLYKTAATLRGFEPENKIEQPKAAKAEPEAAKKPAESAEKAEAKPEKKDGKKDVHLAA